MSDENDLVLWPREADQDYIAARRELLAAERELYAQAERVAAARRALPPGAQVGDYRFDEGPLDLALDGGVHKTALGDLFGPHRTLFLYHLMFEPGADQACPMCSMWVDGFRGVAAHLAQHTAFAVVAKAPLADLRSWGRRRDWRGVRLISSYDTTFNRDFGFETTEGAQAPGVSVFVRDGELVRHFYSGRPDLSPRQSERGIDLLSPVWQVLDLLPGGRGDWYAGNDYVPDARS